MKFGEHYDLVRSLVRPDRLLELRLGDGWGPLCEFLIVERPKVDYPRTNDTATASKRFEAVVQYTMWLVINRLLVLGLTFGGAVYFLSRLWQLLGLRHFGAKMWEANTLNE